MDTKTKCSNCGKVGEFSDGWYEVDGGDLCPACAAEMFDASLDD